MKSPNIKPRERRLAKLSLFFFRKPKFMALLWIVLLVFGGLSYATFMRREGFPTINIPYSLVSGSYLVNDPSKVDNDVAKPLSKIITKQPGVETVDAQSGKDFYSIVIQYKDGTDSKSAAAVVEKAVKAANVLPSKATAEFKPLSPGVDQQGHDILISFYSTNNSASTQQLYDKASQAVRFLNQGHKIALANQIEAVDPFARGIDPVTGKESAKQQTFDRYDVKDPGQPARHYVSVAIGIKGTKNFDVLKLDKQVHQALDQLNSNSQFSGYLAQVSYSAAPDINDQISNLQHSLLDGLIAILIVSALLIAFRAALITILAMVTVLVTTIGVLYLIGYSLNTITLFSLILCLSLIVDDTIIMVEAIDAERRRNKDAYDTVKHATGKISRAMLAATLTATIGFLPLLFVSGILGSFIKAIPVTVVTSLLVSLFVALSFIPFFAKFLLLRKSQLGHGEDDHESPAHHIEAFVAKTLCRPLFWAQKKRRRQFGVGISAVIVGIGFILAGGFLFQKVTFDIFPADKDGDIISAQLTFAPGQSIDQVQATTERADRLITSKLGENFKNMAYYNSGTTQNATSTIVLLSFKKRTVTSPQLSKDLEADFANFKGAQIKIGSVGAGPPASAFNVYIETGNRPAAYQAAQAISTFMRQKTLVRADGSKAHFKTVNISNPDTYSRNNNNAYIAVSGEFDGTDTTTLVTLAQDAIKAKFNDKQMANYGLKAKNLTFNIGTQEDFQKSFNKLAFAFPILLIAIYLFLTTQFRSLLQPLLIFMAIPFSLFGITSGLWLTHNAFSFFTLLGFFALLGLSIKNTILLTDYANQARRAGAGHIEAVAISLQERFRPLVATSLTAIISLIPLYLSNPFWEGLTVTLMFGLLSSTFLVITVFPYYYLGGEYLRTKISYKAFLGWLIPNIFVIVAAAKLASGKAVLPAFAIFNLLIILGKVVKRKRKR